MTKGQIDAVLESVHLWPQEDQEELAEIARLIAFRRKGVYVLTDEERFAIENARKSPLVPEKKMKAFWKRYGVGA